MRNCLGAVVLLLAGCSQEASSVAPKAETVIVDPQAVRRIQLRLGSDPASTFGVGAAPTAPLKREVHARGLSLPAATPAQGLR